MAGITTELSVAAKLAAKVIGKKVRREIEPAPDLEHFTKQLQSLLDKAPPTLIKQYEWFELSANRAPWVASDISLTKGDEVSCFVEGQLFANKLLDIRLPLKLQIWCKVGDGDIFRGTSNDHSFIAQEDGVLQFGNYFPNDWQSPKGDRQQDDKVYKSCSGNAKILIIQWADSALEGLQELASLSQEQHRLNQQIKHLEQGDTTPKGWNYLWNIGPDQIFRDAVNDNGHSCIQCHTAGDTGILQKAVNLPLNEQSEISWRWCIDQLPSSIREDAVPSHDYLSIAVEFDNGRDITYYWSNSLAAGTGYDCPLPNWKGKEYHVVIRSGSEGLGEWQNERRNLYNDYKHYMGDPPARIVKVWLIANSVFQRHQGSCDYADIVLHQGNENLSVL